MLKYLTPEENTTNEKAEGRDVVNLLGTAAFASSKHRWFSGRMLACHAGGPGSIPGRCNLVFWDMTTRKV